MRTAISLESDIRFYSSMLSMALGSVGFWKRWADNAADRAHLAHQQSCVRKYRMKIRWAENKLSDICR